MKKGAVLSNLRENILIYRVRYTISGDTSLLTKAAGFLERYFFLLAFASYVEEAQDQILFSEWLRALPGMIIIHDFIYEA